MYRRLARTPPGTKEALDCLILLLLLPESYDCRQAPPHPAHEVPRVELRASSLLNKLCISCTTLLTPLATFLFCTDLFPSQPIAAIFYSRKEGFLLAGGRGTKCDVWAKNGLESLVRTSWRA